MPLDDVYQIVHSGTLMGEVVQNVYFYRADTGTPSAIDLNLAFQEDIVPEILDFTCDNLVFNTVRVINLGSLTDFSIATTNDPGAANVNMLPPECAVNMTLRLDTRAVRPGSKRYSGLMASATTDGVITDAGVITSINQLATALGSPIGYDTEPVAMYKPIVVKRVPYVTAEGKDSYRLPITDLELVFGNVTGVLVNLNVSHQDTRDNGR